MISRENKLLLFVLTASIVLWTGTGCTTYSASVQMPEPVLVADRSPAASVRNPDEALPSPVKDSSRTLSKAPSYTRLDTSSRSTLVPPYPFKKSEEKPKEKAKSLFRLARLENTNLRWDDCLAAKAVERARRMVEKGHFDHREPRTGENPAWSLVASCFNHNYAGENLAMGEGQSATAIHEELMESPTHRRNILNPNYDLLGVGCYEYICVELFAGF